jgi:hypothetical protein
VVNVVVVTFLCCLKGISIVKMTQPLEIPVDSNLLGCCCVLSGESWSTFLEDHYSSCDPVSLDRKALRSF